MLSATGHVDTLLQWKVENWNNSLLTAQSLTAICVNVLCMPCMCVWERFLTPKIIFVTRIWWLYSLSFSLLSSCRGKKTQNKKAESLGLCWLSSVMMHMYLLFWQLCIYTHDWMLPETIHKKLNCWSSDQTDLIHFKNKRTKNEKIIRNWGTWPWLMLDYNIAGLRVD